MPKILHIESSTLTCSVAVAVDGKCTSLRESHDKQYSHSEKLVVFVDEVINEAGLKPLDLDAVCVAKGPGSYTGLRIGVSAAKGLCYGSDLPLISAGALESMANWAIINFSDNIDAESMLCPMIDARRMEVYSQLFDYSGIEVRGIEAEIIDEQSFSKELSVSQVVFFGDGATKCKTAINHPNAVFIDDFKTSAQGMISIAERKFAANEFEDVAYFEPYYLKDFVAGKPKKIF